ncbi:hypothetical protein W97_02675 [Coniosporium apollinis CBS 100218]|uniref:SnoaL-like domain-containing protein n=1 Tax=Coniosporium apollinis (strain CBS 100218) TaxID=1168221 RepID=R7YNH3_CONA1|nr:uncharacterized protein W97_02675 [Coniosporium apollinis CBS 100218]EON63447.1 hypothetical protein W97_02675 [Coniosporium apollinis CBS 100218]
MTSYTSDYPSTDFDADFKKFFEEFYATSDTPDAHDKYADSFTEDATLIMASKKAKGRSEILALRKGLWEKVSGRLHKPLKVFPYGANADEVMLFGTVDYELKDGRKANVDWSAHAHLVKQEGKVKMDFYQVYLDSAAQNPSK